MNNKNYKHISSKERILIVDDFNSGTSMAAIGIKRNRNKSTISRVLEKCKDKHYVEVGKGFWKEQEYYHSERGDLLYAQNRQKCTKPTIIKDGTNLTRYIGVMMKQYKSSPYDIVKKLDDIVFDMSTGKFLKQTYRERFHIGDVSVSESTIYNAIHSSKIHDLKPYMMLCQYKKGKKYAFKEGKRTNGDSIDLISKELMERDTDGMWEGDTIVGCRGSKAVLLTLTNRKTNDEVVLKIPNRTKPSVVEGLNKIERILGTKKFNEIFMIIIFDNGVEFRDVEGIQNSCITENIKRTKIYFAHPYKSNDRAINENNNKVVRKYFGKGTNFDKVTDKQVFITNMLVNLMHRKRLEGKSSYEMGSIMSMSNYFVALGFVALG